MKGGKNFVLVALGLFLILSLSLVSAGWFSDLFKVTGEATGGGEVSFCEVVNLNQIYCKVYGQDTVSYIVPNGEYQEHFIGRIYSSYVLLEIDLNNQRMLYSGVLVPGSSFSYDGLTGDTYSYKLELEDLFYDSVNPENSGITFNVYFIKGEEEEFYCGDNFCQEGETFENCPADCVEEFSCADTDGGIDYDVKGSVSGVANGNEFYVEDVCPISDIVDGSDPNVIVPDFDPKTLTEYYCDGVNLEVTNYICPNGCERGACMGESIDPTPDKTVCTDTDGGIYYEVLGSVTSVSGIAYDTCIDENILKEYSCDANDALQGTVKNCEFGCSGGVCLKEGGIVCIDTDEGKNIFVSGATHNNVGNGTDVCLYREVLEEFYCDADGGVVSSLEYCENDCLDGKCIGEVKVWSPDYHSEAYDCSNLNFVDGIIKFEEDGSIYSKNYAEYIGHGTEGNYVDFGANNARDLRYEGDVLEDGTIIKYIHYGRLGNLDKSYYVLDITKRYVEYCNIGGWLSTSFCDKNNMLKNYVTECEFGCTGLKCLTINESQNLIGKSFTIDPRNINAILNYEEMYAGITYSHGKGSSVGNSFSTSFEVISSNGEKIGSQVVNEDKLTEQGYVFVDFVINADTEYAEKLRKSLEKFSIKATLDYKGEIDEIDETDNCVEQVFEGVFDSKGNFVGVFAISDPYYCQDGFKRAGGQTTPRGRGCDSSGIVALMSPCETGTRCINGVCSLVEQKSSAALESCDNGCILNEKCFDFGYRKKGNFCSESQEFISQLGEGLTCENNFECDSNLCIDSACVSSSAWKKFMNWWTKFFGDSDETTSNSTTNNTKITETSTATSSLGNLFNTLTSGSSSRRESDIADGHRVVGSGTYDPDTRIAQE